MLIKIFFSGNAIYLFLCEIFALDRVYYLVVVKYLKKNNIKCWLCPANSKFQDIEITEDMNMEIWGVVTSILINPGDVR